MSSPSITKDLKPPTWSHFHSASTTPSFVEIRSSELIICPMNNEHRRLVLVGIENRTRATHEIPIARGFLSKERRNMCRAQSCQIAHTKQINGADYIAGVAEIFAHIENLRPGCGSEYRRQVTASRFANDRDPVWIVAILMRACFKPPNRGLAILDLRRPQC